ncbi:MAG TPA: cell wall hydrolase, partial [Saccharofermentans sp.]|nr:cell wall hydrolase [Saccharofermentans sp.]
MWDRRTRLFVHAVRVCRQSSTRVIPKHSQNNSFVQVRTLPLWNEMWCRNPQEYFITKLILMLSWLIIPFLLNSVETNDTLFTYSLPEIEIKADLPIRGDVVLLAKLINAESPYEPYAGQWAVASVVVNRMAYLKKDLTSVVFQRGQFDGIRSKRFKTWTREQYKIAYKALVGGI